MNGSASRFVRKLWVAFGLCLAEGCALAQSAPTLSGQQQTFLRSVAAKWNLPEPSLVVSDFVGVYADRAGNIQVGSGYFTVLANISDSNLADAAIKFTLAHELWHLRQFADEGQVGAATDNGAWKECIADAMAANAVASIVLESREPLTQAEFREQLEQIAVLRSIPTLVFRKFPGDPQRHGHLAENQRDMAIFFGISRANFDWSNTRRQREKLSISQLNDFAGRFVDRQSPDAQTDLSTVCNHITRQGREALQDLTVFDMSGDLEGAGSSTPYSAGYSEITNRGNRAIRYSFIGVSGYQVERAGAEPTPAVFVDAIRHTVDVPAKSTVKLPTRIRFPVVSIAGARIVMLHGPMREDALVSAKYTSDEPVPRNCGEMAAAPAMRTAVHQALLRMGGSASDNFIPLRGEPSIPGMRTSNMSYMLNIEVADARAQVLYSSNGSSFATLAFAEKQNLRDAQNDFEAAVAAMRLGCRPLLDDVRVRAGSDGLPRFSIPRLTRQSSANVTISQTGDASKNEPVRYAVIWFVQPIVESHVK